MPIIEAYCARLQIDTRDDGAYVLVAACRPWRYESLPFIRYNYRAVAGIISRAYVEDRANDWRFYLDPY